MGARKLKWNEGEECALKAGVEKHGAGKWRTILKDEQFGPILKLRSNVDLKDKWRNMTSTHQPGTRDKKRSRKVKSSDSPNTATAMDCNSPNSTSSSTSVGHQDMIICALRTLQANNPKGSDFNAIHQFIRSHYELPANFKSIMDSRLKEMASKGIVDLQGGVYLLKYDEGQYSSDFSAEHEVSSSQTSVDGNQQTYDFESLDELLAFDAEDGFELELADPFMDFAEECEAMLSDDGPSYSRIFDQFLEQGVVIVC